MIKLSASFQAKVTLDWKSWGMSLRYKVYSIFTECQRDSLCDSRDNTIMWHRRVQTMTYVRMEFGPKEIFGRWNATERVWSCDDYACLKCHWIPFSVPFITFPCRYWALWQSTQNPITSISLHHCLLLLSNHRMLIFPNYGSRRLRCHDNFLKAGLAVR